jgi:hypothetical protein
MRKLRGTAIVLAVAVVAIAAAVLMMGNRESGPPFRFLLSAKLLEDKFYTTAGGNVRRVQVYATPANYKTLKATVEQELFSLPRWTAKTGATAPTPWQEYWSHDSSVEIVADRPISFSVNPIGVAWSPSPKPALIRTIYVTRPAGWAQDIPGSIGRFFKKLLGR